MVNYSIGDVHLKLNDTFWHGVGFFATQFVLVIITLGIYIFAAYVHVYRYICDNCEVHNNTTGDVYQLGFSGESGKGFLYLLGQFALTLITAGLYVPRFYANVFNWFINQTYVDGRPEPVNYIAPEMVKTVD